MPAEMGLETGTGGMGGGTESGRPGPGRTPARSRLLRSGR